MWEGAGASVTATCEPTFSFGRKTSACYRLVFSVCTQRYCYFRDFNVKGEQDRWQEIHSITDGKAAFGCTFFSRRWNLQPADIWYFVFNWIQFKCSYALGRCVCVPACLSVHHLWIQLHLIASSLHLNCIATGDGEGVAEKYNSVTWE